jgi:hypothetical protein
MAAADPGGAPSPGGQAAAQDQVLAAWYAVLTASLNAISIGRVTPGAWIVSSTSPATVLYVAFAT